MNEAFARTARLLGTEAVEKLESSHVIVFGIGGVGGYVVEALVRSGVGRISIVDKDTVDITNLNRQIIATLPAVGRDKVDVMEERIRSINPDCQVTRHKCFYLPENKDTFDLTSYDYVVDAIDTVTAKLQLVEQAFSAGTPIISSMGAGNKINPAMFEVADISETSIDRLARVMRKELRKRGIEHLKVVYSKERPISPMEMDEDALPKMEEEKKPVRVKQSPGSISFAPAVAGLILASEVIKDLTGVRND